MDKRQRVMTGAFAVFAGACIAAAGCGSPPPDAPAAVTVKTFTVRFAADGGAPEPKDQIVPAGGAARLPTLEPRLEGKRFGGWYRDDAPYEFAEPVEADIELRARWTAQAPSGPADAGGKEPDTFTETFEVSGEDEWELMVNRVNKQGSGTKAQSLNYKVLITRPFEMDGTKAPTFDAKNIEVVFEGGAGSDIPAVSLAKKGALLSVADKQTFHIRRVTLKGLSKAGGAAADNDRPLAYIEGGALYLKDGAAITGNTHGASGNVAGGGVYVAPDGTFCMEENAAVSGNTALSDYDKAYGGGVYVDGGTFTMSGNAEVSGNKSESKGNYTDGAGVYVSHGVFTMGGNAKVSANAITFSPGCSGSGNGAGVCGGNSYITMTDNAELSSNTGASYGGGAYVSGGTFTLEQSAKIAQNTAVKNGGGVYCTNDARFTQRNASAISGNTARLAADDTAGDFGGGGICIRGGVFTMEDNAAIFGNKTETNGYGGGVLVTYGVFVMKGNAVRVYGNTAEKNGGGIYLYGGGKWYIRGGTVYGSGEAGQDNGVDLKNTAENGAAFAAHDSNFTAQYGNDFNQDGALEGGTGLTAPHEDTVTITDGALG